MRLPVTPIESFTSEEGLWINKPAHVTQTEEQLLMRTGANTDFWVKTWYGFERHSGHAFGFMLEEEFTLEVKIAAAFEQLYDQAGIFIEASETQWVKSGIEYNDGAPAIGCVVTQGLSDWSTGVFPGDAREFWMRATLEKQALRLQYSTDGKTWPLLRLFPWQDSGQRFVGVMCCSPEREGLDVRFEQLRITRPLGKTLHDLS